MYIIMLGAPGTGKGTIGAEICKHYNLNHVSTGDIFREEIKNKTELGKIADEYISQGKLVPDELTIKMVEKRLEVDENVILDGFPRTVEQAEALKRFLRGDNRKVTTVTTVVNLLVPDEDIIKRTSKRIVCSNKKCGASYNPEFLPPKVEGICDRCGSELIKRKDDEPETIKHRLAEYYKNTEPLVEYYKSEGILEPIEIDIYSPTTKEDTTREAINRIEKHLNKK